MATKFVGIEATAQAAWQAGFRGDALVTAIAVPGPESGYYSDAENDSAAGQRTSDGRTWGPAVGLYQIRTIVEETGTGSDRDIKVLKDPTRNARAAYTISAGGTNWGPWKASASKRSAYLAEARRYADIITARNAGLPNASTPGGLPAPDPDAGIHEPRHTPGDEVRVSSDVVAGVTIAELVHVRADYTILDVGKITVLGKDLDERVGASIVVGGGMDLTTDGIAQLSVVLADPGLAWLRSGVLIKGAAVHLAELVMEIAAREVAQAECEELTVTARDAVGMAMKRLRGRPSFSDASATQIVYTEAQECGARGFVMHGTRVRSNEVRTAPENKPAETENSWDLMQRLAKEEGFLAFISSGIVFFGPPSWLIQQMPQVKVGWRKGHGDVGLDALEVPNCRDTEDAGDGQPAVTVTVKLPRQRGEQCRPGMRLSLAGMADYDGDYLITKVGWPWDGGVTPAEISAQSPVDPIATKPGGVEATDGSAAGTTTATPGTHSADDFLAFVRQQLGDRYVLGGNGPDAWDCSGLVQAGAAFVGISVPRTAKAIIDACTPISVDEAARTPGALLYHGPTAAGTTGHIVISIGDGQHTIEAMGTKYGVVQGDIGKRFSRGGLIPGLEYHPNLPQRTRTGSDDLTHSGTT